MAEMASDDPPAPGALRIRRKLAADRAVLTLEGELDLASAPELERELQEVAGAKPEHVVIDLTGLNFMDSSGLALMYRALQSARANGQQLSLRRGPAQVHRLFELTRMVDEFTFDD